MFKKLSLATAGVIASLTLLAPLHAAENWRAWNIHNDGHPNTAAMDKFSELVDAATGGEVKVNCWKIAVGQGVGQSAVF